jgi:hypothetical protein
MSFLTRPVEDLLQLLLNRVHGGFLQTPLDSEHLIVNLRQGVYTLTDMEVCPRTVNAQLKDSPVHITSASIKLVQLQLPSFYRILDDAVVVVVQDAEVNLCSAALSGYSVNLKEGNREAERLEDDQGVNLLTNFIGSILSNIEISFTRLTLNIRAAPDSKAYLSVQFPKIRYKTLKEEAPDQPSKKRLVFKEMAVSYVDSSLDLHPDYQTLFSLPRIMKVNISFTRELLTAKMRYDSLQFILGKDQFLAVLQILSQLRPTSLVELEEHDLRLSGLEEELKANLTPKLKDRKLKFSFKLRSFSVIVGLDHTDPFIKVTSEQDPNLCFPGSHLFLTATDVKLAKAEILKLSVAGLSVSSHVLVDMPSVSGGSSMFYSANSMVSSDFFRSSKGRLKWELDRSKQHFCSHSLVRAKVWKTADAKALKPSALLVQVSSDRVKVVSCSLEVFLTEAVLGRLLDLNLPKAGPEGPDVQEDPRKTTVFIPTLTATYEQTEGLCSCEGLKRVLQFSCKSIRCKQASELDISAAENTLTMLHIDEESDQVLVFNSFWRVVIVPKERCSEAEDEPEASVVHTEHEHDQRPATFPANLVLDEQVSQRQGDEEHKQGYSRWKFSQSKLEVEEAKVVHVYLKDLKFKADQLTFKSLQLFRPPTLPTSRPGSDSRGEVCIIDLGIDLISVSLVSYDLPVQRSKDFGPDGLLTTQLSVFDVNSPMRKANDTRIEHYKLVLNSAEAKFYQLVGGDCLVKVEVKTAVLMAAANMSRLFETDRNSVFLKLAFNKTHKQDLDVTLQNCSVHLADVQPFMEYLSQMQWSPSASSDQTLTSTHVKICNTTLTFIQPVATLVSCIDELRIWLVFMNSSPSQALNIDLRTCHFELAEGHVEVVPSADRSSKLFTEVLCIESTQVYLSLSEHAVEPHRSMHDSSIVDCDLGECELVVPFVYLSTSQMSQAQDKWGTLHVNVGSVFMHSCKDSLNLLATLASLVKIEASDDQEIVRKDSDLSSDDEGIYKVCRDGLFIEPKYPDRISSFSLLDYLSLGRPQPQVPPPKANKTPTTQVVHCHPEFPRRFVSLSQSLHLLKVSHGQPSLKLSVSLSYFSFNFYAGHDFINSSGLRRSQDCVRLKISNVGAAFCKFPRRDLHYNWRLTCSVESVEVRDFIAHSYVDRLLHPMLQETLLSLEVSSVFPNPLISAVTELVISVKLLPVKLNIDQHFVKFVLEAADLKPQRPEMMTSIGGPPRPFTNSIPAFLKVSDHEKRPLYLQRLEVEGIEVSIDYIPRPIAMEGIPFAANALSILTVETIRLSFPRVVIRASSDPVEAVMQIKDLYLAHIMSNELGEILCKLTPISSLYNFAEAAYILAVSPYQVGLMGVKAALISFVKVGSLESLRIFNRCIKAAIICYSLLTRIA